MPYIKKNKPKTPKTLKERCMAEGIDPMLANKIAKIGPGGRGGPFAGLDLKTKAIIASSDDHLLFNVVLTAFDGFIDVRAHRRYMEKVKRLTGTNGKRTTARSDEVAEYMLRNGKESADEAIRHLAKTKSAIRFKERSKERSKIKANFRAINKEIKKLQKKVDKFKLDLDRIETGSHPWLSYGYGSLKEWKSANTEEYKWFYQMERKSHKQRRRARIASRYGRIKKREILNRFKEFGDSCAYCGVHSSLADGGLAADHIIPISVAHGNDCYAHSLGSIHNIVPACRKCNSMKHNKDALCFMKEGTVSQIVVVMYYNMLNDISTAGSHNGGAWQGGGAQ